MCVDTNVLLHNPNAIFIFADNEVVIPFDVIEELDKFKAGSDELGRNARTVIRHLDALRATGNLSEGVGVPQTGGRVRVILEEAQQLASGLTQNTARQPHHLLRLMLQRQNKRVVFISKDINARIKSDALGLAPRISRPKRSTSTISTPAGAKCWSTTATIDRIYSQKKLKLSVDRT